MRSGRLLAAACLIATSALAPMSGAASARPLQAAAGDASVVVKAVGPDGSPVGVPLTLYAGGLTQDTSNYYNTLDALGNERQDPGQQSGMSIRGLISRFGVDPSIVRSAVIAVNPSLGQAVLSADSHDFDDPLSATFPFNSTDQGPLQPIFVQVDPGFRFVVPIRTPPAVLGVTNGKSYEISESGNLTMTLSLTTTLLVPTVQAPESVPLNTTVALSGEVTGPDPATLTWTWTYDDQSPTEHGPSVSHRFSQPGNHLVIADVVGNGTSGRATVSIYVPPTTTPTRGTTPPPGSPAGTGGSTAPVNGPVTGNGPRVGGVPTARTGNGRAGSTFDPRSPGASATASGAATQAAPGLVGYLLAGPDDQATPVPLAGGKPLDDSAPAARDGRTVQPFAAWLTAALVVVALLVLGAGSERRRPARSRPRRRS